MILAGGGRGQFSCTLSRVLSFSMHSLLYMTQQFVVATSKSSAIACSYICQQSQHTRAWERGYISTATHLSALSTADWLLFQQST